MTPTIRNQGIRSTFSSPPILHPPNLPPAPPASFGGVYQQQQQQQTLSPTLSSAQLHAYQESQPTPAPVLAHQDESLWSQYVGGHPEESGHAYFCDDNPNPVQWYSTPTAIGAGSDVEFGSIGFSDNSGAQDLWEFNNFDFTISTTASPPSVDCSLQSQQVPPPLTASIPPDDPIMPLFVDHPYQHLPAPIPQQHTHALLNWMDFISDNAHGFEHPHSQSQSPTPYTAASSTDFEHPPTSPSVSLESMGIQKWAHTPHGEIDVSTDVTVIPGLVDPAAPSYSFGVGALDGGFYGGEQKMMNCPTHSRRI